MSAKSKNKPRKPSNDPSKDVKVGKVVDENHPDHLALEQLVDAPKGTSPLMWFFMASLVVLLTAIFAIDPGSIQRAMQGGAGTYLTWTGPDGEKVEMSARKFQLELRKLSNLLGGQGSLEHSDVMRYLVLADLAEGAGIAVTDKELREQLLEMASYYGKPTVEAMMMRSPGNVAGYQETLRKQMMGVRYLQLISSMAANVEPDEVERLWREAHQEYAYDYVGIEVANLLEDALAEVPDDAALATWLAELSPGEQSQFNEPPRVSAELVGYLIGGANTAEGLLARYPEPAKEEPAAEEAASEDAEASADESEDAAETDAAEAVEDDGANLAKEYYDAASFWRFVRPAPAEGEPALDLLNRSMTFEEVEDEARAEAPIYFALKRWLEDVQLREAAGTPVDLAAEAEELGLSYLPADQAYSRPEWTEVEGWGGPSLGGRIDRLSPGQLSSGLMIEQGALLVARQKERVAAYLPELPEIKEAVVAAWADQRAGELALAKLTALRESFAPSEVDAAEDASEGESAELEAGDAEASAESETDAGGELAEAVTEPKLPTATEAEFTAAVAALGLEVGRRPYMEQAQLFSLDPDGSDPAHLFIRTRSGLEDLAAGELSEPELNPTKQRAYLLRAVGGRDPEPWRMSPGEFDRARQQASNAAYSAFLEANLDDETLFEQVGLVIAEDNRP